jgi:monofunctional biosynthetic peptidoglycan transglycosylase
MKLLKRILRGIVVAFFASTILSVVALRFIPVVFTPLMFIRCYQQVKEGRELLLSHRWVSLDRMSEYMPVAVIAS